MKINPKDKFGFYFDLAEDTAYLIKRYHKTEDINITNLINDVCFRHARNVINHREHIEIPSDDKRNKMIRETANELYKIVMEYYYDQLEKYWKSLDKKSNKTKEYIPFL